MAAANQAQRAASPRGAERLSLAVMLLANLLPLAGVLWFGWDLLSVLLLYWLENLLFALVAVVRMLRVGGLAALGTVLLLTLVFAALAAVQLEIIAVLARAVGLPVPQALDPAAVADAPLFTALQGIYLAGLQWIIEDRPDLLLTAFPALLLSHLVELLTGPDRSADRVRTTPVAVMRAALGHVAVMHLALLAGATVLALLRAATLTPVLAALVLLKLLLELRVHRRASHLAQAD